MNIAVTLRLIFIVSILQVSISANGQTIYLYPIVRDTLNIFEDSIEIEGYIVNISGFHPQCGVMCTSEKIEVKLTKKSTNYPYPYAYVAFTCFHRISEDEVDKILRLKLKKIEISDHSCFWTESKFNPINSYGFPFYQLLDHSVK